ncbi:MAG TPA: tripartite tricarboxylate transporter substrate binding protein [Xanthobacteraceae bacterium]|jgi:tripartite-type tricarboxylate transporter receptor subunit TctC|nr:tripartite tricarboxylate transporter substrate binding protein [Xanthobacteraceae bacterium]
MGSNSFGLARLRFVAQGSVIFAASLFGWNAVAQQARLPDYPNKLVRILSLVPAGGLSDIALRPLTQALSEQTGQTFIVENRPGGGGLVEGRACAHAAPDGYVICNVDNEVVSNPDFLFKDVGYNTQKDFAAITNGYYIINGFVASSELNVKNLNDLIALSKSRPEGINVATPATSLQIFVQSFAKHTGANFHVIPYKSGAEVANGLLTNAVQAAAVGLGNALPLIQAGEMKALSVDSAERTPLLPDVPTLKEMNFDSLRIKSWYGFVAPTGTPKSIISFLHDSIVNFYSRADIRQRVLINAALEPIFNTPEEFAQFLIVDRERTAAEVKLVGIEPQ